MSDMEWTSQYDANAAPYVSPDIVKEYYENNPRYPSWSSPAIEGWFNQKCKSRDTTSNHKHTNGCGKPLRKRLLPQQPHRIIRAAQMLLPSPAALSAVS